MRRGALVGMALWGTIAAASPAAGVEMREGWLVLSVTPKLVENLVNETEEWGAGVRAGGRLSERWAIEGAVEHAEQSHVFQYREAWNLDLSARYSFLRHDRWELFVLGGAGWTRREIVLHGPFSGPNDFPDGIEAEGDGPTVHVGLGFEIDLGERWFFRPEVRQRWTLEDEPTFDDHDHDVSVGIGLRF